MDPEFSADILDEILRSRGIANRQLEAWLVELVDDYKEAEEAGLGHVFNGSNWDRVIQGFVAYGQALFDVEARYIVAANPTADELMARLTALRNETFGRVLKKRVVLAGPSGPVPFSIHHIDAEARKHGVSRVTKILIRRFEHWSERVEAPGGSQSAIAERRKRRITDVLRKASSVLGRRVLKEVIWKAAMYSDRSMLNHYENASKGQTKASVEAFERVLDELEEDPHAVVDRVEHKKLP